jgi:hypothetical protein
MSLNEENPEEWLRALGEKFQKISFGGGVVGKTTQAVLALAAIWLAIIFKLSDSIVLDAILLVIGAMATATVVWWIRRTHDFAARNPLQAILSGSQFVEYHRFTAQVKGLSSPSDTALTAAGTNLPATHTGDPGAADR